MVILLGDSIFDNGSYVNQGEKDVLGHLRDQLKSQALEASLLAVDGSLTQDVLGQLQRIPAEATHLVISSGGNDALQVRYALSELLSTSGLLTVIKQLTSGNLLGSLLEIRAKFVAGYSELLTRAKQSGLPTVVCTIYDKCPGVQDYERMLLSIFNDIIISQASSRGVPIIDLRAVCTEPDDYSAVSPIEPSSKGAARIAGSIAFVVAKHDFELRRSVIY